MTTRTVPGRGLAAQLGAPAGRMFRGPLPRAELPALFAESDAMVYPCHRAGVVRAGLIERWRRAGGITSALGGRASFFATARTLFCSRWRPRRAGAGAEAAGGGAGAGCSTCRGQCRDRRGARDRAGSGPGRGPATRDLGQGSARVPQLTDDVQTDHVLHSLANRCVSGPAEPCPPASPSTSVTARRQNGSPAIQSSSEADAHQPSASNLHWQFGRSGPCLDESGPQRRGGPGSAAGSLRRGEQPTAVEVCKTFGSLPERPASSSPDGLPVVAATESGASA